MTTSPLDLALPLTAVALSVIAVAFATINLIAAHIRRSWHNNADEPIRHAARKGRRRG